jgi:hypothetical protein
MFVGGGGVLLGLVMLADGMVVVRLMVMMGRGMVVSGGIMMVLGGGMLALFGHNCSPGWRLGGAHSSCWKSTCSSPVFPRLQDSCRYARLLAGFDVFMAGQLRQARSSAQAAMMPLLTCGSGHQRGYCVNWLLV